MPRWVRDDGNPRFVGSLDDDEDSKAAAEMAAGCPFYSTDDDEEDYCEGETTCFNCRYRRWLADGFECVKGFPCS